MDALRIAAVQLDYTPNMSTTIGNFWLPDEPAAPADPLAEVPPHLTMRKLRDWPHTQHAYTNLRQRNERTSDGQLSLRLKQILDYCAAISCDLVVFPEASVPISLIPVLSGYSTTLAIFAGIGLLRTGETPAAHALGAADIGALQNWAVFLHDGQVRPITKFRLADGERADPGTGIVTFRLDRRGRSYGVAAAICRDFLADDDRIQDAEFPVDIVLTSALSKNTAEFIERTPRQLRVFANHAYYGGTCVQVPHLSSLGLSNRLGSDPLPAGTEGVVVVDYFDLPRKVTGPQATHNRVIARAAVVYDDRTPHEPEQATEARIIRGLRDLRADALDVPPVTAFLEGAANLLGEGGNRILARAVDLLRENQLSGTISPAELLSLTQHVLLTDVQSAAEVKFWQVESLLNTVVASLSQAPDTGAGLGRFRDDLLGVKTKLLDRLRYQAFGDHLADRSAVTDGEPAGTVQSFYNATLGSYDAEAAVQSLPLQLDALRTLAAERDPALSLTYRLSTKKSLSAELVAIFVATGEVLNADPPRVDGLREGLGQLLGVAHSAAWETSAATSATEELDWSVEIRPRDPDWKPPLSEDWAPLIDLLRAQENETELTIVCSISEESRATSGEPSNSVIELAPGRFIDKFNKSAAEYLASVVNDQTPGIEPANLILQFFLRAPAEVPQTLIHSVGLKLIGSLNFDLVAPGTMPPTSPMLASEALRVFHPPYGQIQGRGIARGRPTRIPLQAVNLPSGGVSIGAATLASARYDRSMEVRLDAESRLRHMYVIGRTGSGKTNFLKTLARQDVAAGAGVAVIDPHGDLVDHLLRQVGRREDEVVLLDFGDPEGVPVLNPIDLDVSPGLTNARRLAIDDLIGLIVRQSYHTFHGPRFEDIIRLTLESLVVSKLTDTPTVLDVSRVLRSKERRTRLVGSLDDPDLIDRWRNFDMQRGPELAELIHWALATFSNMDRDGILGPVLGGGRSSVSINEVVNNGGILLAKIPEWQVGPAASAFIGGLIQERIRRAAFDRFSTSRAKTAPFYLYVDEFQKFATSGFEELVAEARKFGLGLTMSHQNLRQLEDFSRFTGSASRQLLESVLGNVANMVALGVSASDADQLSKEFGVPAEALRNISANTGLVRADLRRGETRTFSVRIPYAESDPGVLSSPQVVRERMLREGYWRSRSEVSAFMSQNRIAMEGPTNGRRANTSAQASAANAEAPNVASRASETVADRFLKQWREIRASAKDAGINANQTLQNDPEVAAAGGV